MKNEEYVYFLAVKQAVEIATKHSYGADWDLWTDAEAIAKGMMTATVYPNTSSCTKYDGCAYLPLCRAHGDFAQCTEEYRQEKAYVELEADHASPQL